MALTQPNEQSISATPAQVDVSNNFLTLLEVAEQLKVNEDTVRRLFVRAWRARHLLSAQGETSLPDHPHSGKCLPSSGD
jgi:hypothetical protein